jgi:Tol biopolymer transport system component
VSLTAILLLAGACATGTSPSPSLSAQPSTLAASPTPAATPYAIEDGEPWIVYEQAYTDAAGVEGTGVLLVLPDGPEPHQLLTVRAEHPDWSPDGQRIAVAAGLANGVSEIWSVNADGTDAKTLVACVDAPCTALAAPAWSPDGKQLAFQRYLQPAAMGYEDDQIALEVLNLATGTSRVVAMSPTVADGKYIEYVLPRWSPDGTQIVFALHWYPTPPTDENILGSSIAVVRADGSEADAPRILTPPSLFGAYPDWSPDGQHIVFNTYPIGSFQDTTKAQNLYTIRPDGTEMTQVTHFGENDTRAAEPTWTPDGTRIIFMYIARDPSNPSGARSIAFVDADGSNLTVIPVFGTHPRLRPTP